MLALMIRLTRYVSEVTGSGILGICGPYGDYAGLVLTVALSVIPLSIVAGILASRRAYLHFTRVEQKE